MARDTGYRTYSSRWWVWGTAASLNIFVNASWLSFSPVTTQAAAYFETTVSGVDFFLAAATFAGMPLSLTSTWIIDKIGLRWNILASSSLAFLGAFIKCIVTFPGIEQNIDKDVQYWSTILAQFLLGAGNPLAFAIPNKVTREWFRVEESAVASGGITLSMVLGTCIALSIPPLFVSTAEDIPTLNIVWFIPLAITFIMAITFVRSDQPPTPPSRSAEHYANEPKTAYLEKMRLLFTNKNYIVIMIMQGMSIGYFNALITQMQQILCSRNYEHWLTSAVTASVMLSGIVGGGIQSFIAGKTGHIASVGKISYNMGVLFIVATLYCLRQGGLLVFGIMPIGVELSQESTYPLDPAAPIAIIHFVSLVSTTVFIFISGLMEQPLPEGVPEQCSVEGSNIEAKDHTHFLVFLMSFVAFGSLFYTFGYKADYRRQRANLDANSKGC